MNGKSGKSAKVIFFTKTDTINSSEMKTTAKPIKDGKRMWPMFTYLKALLDKLNDILKQPN